MPGLLAASPKNCTLTNSMERSRSPEESISPARLGNGGPSVFWNRLHKTTPLLLIPSHMNPLHSLPSCFFNPVSSNILHCIPRGLLPSGFPIKILFSSIHSICPALTVLCDFMVLMVSGIPPAERSKACGRSLAGIAGSNFPGGGGVHICLPIVKAVCCHVDVSATG